MSSMDDNDVVSYYYDESIQDEDSHQVSHLLYFLKGYLSKNVVGLLL